MPSGRVEAREPWMERPFSDTGGGVVPVASSSSDLVGHAVRRADVLFQREPDSAGSGVRAPDRGRLRLCGMHDVPNGIGRGLLLRGPRRLPILQWSPHGPDCRSRQPAGAGAAVGDLSAQAVARHARRPPPSRRRGLWDWLESPVRAGEHVGVASRPDAKQLT